MSFIIPLQNSQITDIKRVLFWLLLNRGGGALNMCRPPWLWKIYCQCSHFQLLYLLYCTIVHKERHINTVILQGLNFLFFYLSDELFVFIYTVILYCLLLNFFSYASGQLFFVELQRWKIERGSVIVYCIQHYTSCSDNYIITIWAL